MKYYDSMGFESEHGIWVRRVDAAALEAALSDWKQWHANLQTMHDRYSKQVSSYIQTLNTVRAMLQSDSIEYDDMRHIDHIIDAVLAINLATPEPAMSAADAVAKTLLGEKPEPT